MNSDSNVVTVSGSLSTEALSGSGSKVVLGSLVVGDLLVSFLLPWSHDSESSNSEAFSSLNRKSPAWEQGKSDRLSSLIELEPLSGFSNKTISHVNNLLSSSVVSMMEVQSSLAGHSRSDLEFDIILKWLLVVLKTFLIDDPGLVESIVASPVDDTLVVGILSSRNIKAELSVVSNVSSRSFVPLSELSGLLLEFLDLSWGTSSESVGSENFASSLVESHGVSSRVEDPPLMWISWIVINKSDVVANGSNWPSAGHLGLDLESDTILDWVLWVLNTLLVDNPTLVGTVVTFPPDDVSLVGVGTSMDIKTSNSNISNVSSVSREPSDLLKLFTLELSDDSVVSVMVPVVSVDLNGDDLGSVGNSSDRSGSPVEYEPLVNVLWVSVSDSQSILMSTDVFSGVEGSSVLHSGSDLESDSISEWVSWEDNSLLGKGPGLVSTIVAWVEDNMSVVYIFTSMDIETSSGVVSNVSVLTSPEGDLLVWLVDPLSESSINSWSMEISVSV